MNIRTWIDIMREINKERLEENSILRSTARDIEKTLNCLEEAVNRGVINEV